MLIVCIQTTQYNLCFDYDWKKVWSQFQCCVELAVCILYSCSELVYDYLCLDCSTEIYYVEDRNSGACAAPSPSLMYGISCDVHVLLPHVYIHAQV